MAEKFNRSVNITDAETGEFLGTYETGSYLTESKRQHGIVKSETFEQRQVRYAQQETLCGGFFVQLTQPSEILLENVTNATLAKLIYLATYIDKNNIISADGGWEGRERKPKPLSKKEIQDLLQVNRQTFSAFWKEATGSKMILETNNGYLMSKDQFRFCDNSMVNKRTTMMVKMFKHAIRYMYQNTDERSKKFITHLYRLIPFINLKYNTLCRNPFEKDVAEIELLTLGDICELVGIDRSHQQRVLSGLKNLRFVDKNGDVRSVITYKWDYKNENRYVVKINPQFYAGYIGQEEMAKMIDDFGVEKLSIVEEI